MDNREFYIPDVPPFPLENSSKIIITQLSEETSIQTWPPGFKTGDDIITHTFYEEVYLLDGSITDLSLNKTFGKGYHAWRNPQMKHGPYQADQNLGCQMLVIVRQSDSRSSV
ncbi:unnamed protein product [Adineta steineri]|uniref:ChrR-like cupin domain-containing protein n=1 Tax=Adineta steineri TaxID=433720 RepID=A0A814D639_9BILA|nr:unnamed protein product [Adineta steineri]CAF0951398.1 unnamed protein product [Adineta steineri]CAF0956998.1 unnamed protein product [Adineta steineri]CAF0962046.1 unnamed protein product [Adineta steineri]CAF4048963.1 unnamed protein product [Adineta steineri]